MTHRTVALTLLLLAGALATAAPSEAALSDWKGRLALGFGHLFAGTTPAGGISVAAGLDYPVGMVRVGPELGYHLLGTRSLTSGSLTANLDYSLFEADVLARWSPTHAGPLRRVSFGPALMAVSAQVSSSSAGLYFEKDQVSAVWPGWALNLAWVPARATAAAVGFELGAHMAVQGKQTWTVATTRFLLVY